MPYILSPLITENSLPMWQEDAVYKKESLYSISQNKLPPVNYDKHIICGHSLTHAEAPKHIQNHGKTIDQYFEANYFYGKCTVIRLEGNKYKKVDDHIFHWEVSLKELQDSLDGMRPSKLLITTNNYRKNKDGFHDPNYVLTLSKEAANWLIENPRFNLFGTSWKSTDHCPGSYERPIHSIIFQKAIILECLDLEKVPSGEYFLSAFPLRIEGASESPLTPILFTKDELKI